jgi:hypothetical protein
VANIARGGTLKDVTRRVHPDNRDLALRVARVFRLHTVGVDLITTDIAKSWRELPCALIEINTAPGISGVGDASVVLRLAFPRRLSGRIPCFVVAGDIAYRQEVAGGLLAALKKAGLATGKADFGDDMTGFDDVQNLLRESRVGAVIVTCPQEAVERCGFPLPRCEILFAEEAHPWTGIAGLAGRRIAGPLAPREVERLTDEAVRPFVSGELGGPRPTLEWLAAAGQPKIRLWRSWTMPAARFWGAILARTVTHNGMAGPGDILSAVVHLADAELARDGQEPTGVRFALAGTDAPWQAAYEDVDVPLLPERAAIVEAALRRAIERVSELVVRSY